METAKAENLARIGRSVTVKGEVSGSEDLYVDGQVEGTIDLQGNKLIVGAEGQVKANVNAKSVLVAGKLEGNIRVSDRTDLAKSAIAIGDIITQRISIEDGAYFKGKVEIVREGAKAASAAVPSVGPEPKPATLPAAAGAIKSN